MGAHMTRSVHVDADGWLPRGLRLQGKHELIGVLRDWLAHSRADTIGDTSHFKGTPWLFVDIGPHRVKVAADTKREAVQRVVDEVGVYPDRPWQVVPNSRTGRVNKVVLTTGVQSGWFAYLITALPRQTSI